MARHIEAAYAAFTFDGNGKPKLSVLSKDHREAIEISLDDLDVALLAQKSTAYLAEQARRK